MDEIHSLQRILDGERDDDLDAFVCFLKDEGLELLAAYRAIGDDDVRASLRELILKIAFPRDPGRGGGGPIAA